MPAGKRPDKSDPALLEPALPPERATAPSPTSRRRRASPGCRRTATAWASAVGDYDNDGFHDLYVTNYGGNTLYHNNGRRHLHATSPRRPAWPPAAGARAPGSSTTTTTAGSTCSSRATWTGAFEKNRYCGEKKPGYRAYCHPDNYDGDDEHPLPQQRRRHVHRRLRRRRASPMPGGKGLGVVLRRLRRRRLHGRLRGQRLRAVVPLPQQRQRHVRRRSACCVGVGFNEDGKTFAGMGVDFADYDNDGRPDVVVTDLSNERYRLFHQGGDGSFQDATNSSGVGAATLAFAGWSTRLLRLRQRRLEGHLRRPGTRDGHDREDGPQPAATCSRRCCCGTSPAAS